MVYRLAQISDTHLSRDKPFFVANFERVAAHVAALRPDLVVNTGDMALDGVIRPDDLVEARRLHEACELDVRFIPGNHDIGDNQDVPNRHGPAISDESRDRYVRLFGLDFWLLDVPSWRILAIDAQLLGSNLAAAEEQLEFIAAAAADAGPRSLALLVHKPLYHRSPDEDAITGRFLNPPARRQLLEALGGKEPALVASGHVHQFLEASPQTAQHVWSPSTAFIFPDKRQPRYGEKRTGYVEHALGQDGTHTSRFVEVAALPTHVITDFPEAYGPMP